MKQSERWRRLPLLVALLALSVPLLSCEDDTPAEPIVVVTPEPVRGTLAQTSFSNFQSAGWVSIEILVSQKGEVDTTVDWTFPDSWIYVYFGRVNCAYEQLVADDCSFLIASETQNPKPRFFRTGLLEPGTYYLYIYNVPRDVRLGIGSDNTESVALALGLTVYPFTSAPGAGTIQLGRTEVVRPPRL
jgi:hypothetical protein